MRYVSTRGGASPVGFSEAVMSGLASDGGLFLPESLPRAGGCLRRWRNLPYRELAAEIMAPFTDLPADRLRDLVDRSCSSFDAPDVAPVVPVGGLYVLELFHGPTLSFKDIALQFLGRLFDEILGETGRELNIVAATSGDTGSAAIYGVRGRKRIRIFVMYPKGRVSPSQERQMTTVLDGNVFNIAVKGTFDDCQRIVKSLLGDRELRQRLSLGAVNSINWARILAQIVYYFYAAFRVSEMSGKHSVSFCVPTGNFGNIFAGYMACRMGLPVERLILATNENDILARFFASGVYARRSVKSTPSPAMDIQVASNFERYLYYRTGEDPGVVRGLMADFAAGGRIAIPPDASGRVEPLIEAGSATGAETLETIRKTHEDFGYLLDPHTAVGVRVAGDCAERGTPVICLATAHPAKFGEAIQEALGRNIAHHEAIDGLTDRPARCTVIEADEREARSLVERALAG